MPLRLIILSTFSNRSSLFLTAAFLHIFFRYDECAILRSPPGAFKAALPSDSVELLHWSVELYHRVGFA